ncbi:MAG: M28 family peptidase [Candidatus Eremiobacteraeota bacterium]|nr:M28 family peptidase [Candidatus Eremiobacteraeota bacterium]
MRQSFVPPENGDGNVDPQICRERVNDTVAKLEACIQQAALWRRLAHFQRIANENPGSQGHPNRNTGTPGYRASVDYVAALMRGAGYTVTIQQYLYKKADVVGTPEFRTASRNYAIDRDWFVARGTGSGAVTAPLAPARGSGCAPSDFAGFTRGNVALIERGACDVDTQVANARAAGAVAAVIYADAASGANAYEARLLDPPGIPVVGVAAFGIGAELLRQCGSGRAPIVHVDIRTRATSDLDYNVIADSPFGDSSHIVVIDAHLDSIYGAGMLDNASGSTTMLEIALNLAKTPTRNRLRYIWFGGEEIGLLGSRYYTKNLTRSERRKIVFDVDADVTATPNFDILIADPQYAAKVKRFPPNVVPESKIGNDYFSDFFKKGGIVSRPAWFGNNGTDSLSFALAGVPNTGILTQQDCCKHRWETKLWGGFRGNYEGQIPSFNGGCVDRPHRWCDNLSNNDPFVLELASKATAYVTFKLANRHFAW